jgi:hypothetical protein
MSNLNHNEENSDSDDEFVSMDGIKQTIFENKTEKEISEETNYKERQELLEKNGISMFQLQGIPKSQYANIVEIGTFTQNPVLQIGKHEQGPYGLELVSCLHSKDDLIKLSEEKLMAIPMVMGKIYYNNGKKITHLFNLWFHYNTSLKSGVNDYLVSRDELKNKKEKQVYGYYSIDLKKGDKRMVLRRIKEFSGNNKIVELMMEQYNSQDVQSMLRDL